MAANVEQTGIVTSDVLVRTGLTRVRWLFVSAGATGGAFQLNDSTDDSGTDKIDITMPANSVISLSNMDLEFKTGLYVDVPGTNVTVNVGYS